MKIKYSSVTNPLSSDESDGQEHPDQQQPVTHDHTEKVECECWVLEAFFFKAYLTRNNH